MRHRVRNSFVNRGLPPLIVALIAATSAVAQTPPNPAPPTIYDQIWTQALAAQKQFSAGSATIGFDPPILTIPGQPFTAQRIYKQWDPGGSSGTPDVTTTVTIARDSQGRIHSENSLTPGAVEVIVSDPVAQFSFRYMAGQPASVQLVTTNCSQPNVAAPAASTQPSAANAPAMPPVPASPVPSKQYLGTKTMDGTLAYGQQQTRYLTSASGLVTIQTVDWFSPTLGLNLQETSQYSGRANHSIDTQQVQLGNPNPSLFTLPSGFTLPDPSANCGTQSNAGPSNNRK